MADSVTVCNLSDVKINVLYYLSLLFVLKFKTHSFYIGKITPKGVKTLQKNIEYDIYAGGKI
jgi:hypothetical protein